MPVVCDACGASNRANAMFCSGCAGRLPGFAPSGPSALDVVGSSRPGPREDLPGARPDWALPPGSSIRILPAERPAFWLRLGMLGLVMCVGFMAWFLYVTRKVDAPPVGGPGGIAAGAPPLAPTSSASAVAAAPAVATAAPVVDRPRTSAVAAAVADTGAAAAEPARRRTQTAESRASARPSQPWPSNASSNVARAQRSRDDASAAVERSLALARADDYRDRGLAADPGPPIVAGPGPQYEWTRTPSRLYDDPGPPVIAGPGPLVDDSPRRAGSR